MPPLHHFLRMMRWARRPPSQRQMWVVLATLLIIAVIWGIESSGWWPDWMSTQSARPPRIPAP